MQDILGVPKETFEDLYNVQNLTKKQVIGASAMSVLDVATLGAGGTSSRLAAKGVDVIAPNLAQGLVKQGLLKTAGKTALAFGKEGLKIGGAYGLAQGAMADEDALGIIKSGAIGAIVGGAFGAATGALSGGISTKLYNNAVKKILTVYTE